MNRNALISYTLASVARNATVGLAILLASAAYGQELSVGVSNTKILTLLKLSAECPNSPVSSSDKMVTSKELFVNKINHGVDERYMSVSVEDVVDEYFKDIVGMRNTTDETIDYQIPFDEISMSIPDDEDGFAVDIECTKVSRCITSRGRKLKNDKSYEYYVPVNTGFLRMHMCSKDAVKGFVLSVNNIKQLSGNSLVKNEEEYWVRTVRASFDQIKLWNFILYHPASPHISEARGLLETAEINQGPLKYSTYFNVMDASMNRYHATKEIFLYAGPSENFPRLKEALLPEEEVFSPGYVFDPFLDPNIGMLKDYFGTHYPKQPDGMYWVGLARRNGTFGFARRQNLLTGSGYKHLKLLEYRLASVKKLRNTVARGSQFSGIYGFRCSSPDYSSPFIDDQLPITVSDRRFAWFSNGHFFLAEAIRPETVAAFLPSKAGTIYISGVGNMKAFIMHPLGGDKAQKIAFGNGHMAVLTGKKIAYTVSTICKDNSLGSQAIERAYAKLIADFSDFDNW
jgi:hypothetical protein